MGCNPLDCEESFQGPLAGHPTGGKGLKRACFLCRPSGLPRPASIWRELGGELLTGSARLAPYATVHIMRFLAQCCSSATRFACEKFLRKNCRAVGQRARLADFGVGSRRRDGLGRIDAIIAPIDNIPPDNFCGGIFRRRTALPKSNTAPETA